MTGGAMMMPFMVLAIGLLILGDALGAPEAPQNSDLARIFGSVLFMVLILMAGGAVIGIIGMILAPGENP